MSEKTDPAFDPTWTRGDSASSAPITDEVTREHPGRYDLRHILGKGSQATVYLAWDKHLGREVAIKVPVSTGGKSGTVRFLREARIAARLEHPNIVPVYEVGQRDDQTPYSVQKLLTPGGAKQAKTFRDALHQAGDLRARLRLLPNLIAVCQGIAYAHSQGVVHRDLKPENIVLGRFGETVIVDWGLARSAPSGAATMMESGRLEPIPTDPYATVAGAAYGTPAYMSPEQARGETVTVDGRTDVWSLGVMLFELLAGRPPYVAKTGTETVALVKEGPEPVLSALAPEAPAELVAIAARALQRHRAARYQSASSLADDLVTWQTGGRVGAYQYGPLELIRLFVARNKLVTAVSAAALLLVLIAAGVAIQKYRQAEGALSLALIERAREAERQFRWGHAAALYAAARDRDDNDQARWGTRLSAARPVYPVERLGGQVAPSKALTFSPDGALLAAGSGDGTIHLWDFARRQRVGSLPGGERAITSLTFSLDGRTLACGNEEGQVRVFDVATRTQRAQLWAKADAVNALEFTRDGRQLLLANEDGTLVLLDAQNGAVVWSRQTINRPLYAVAVSPDGTRAVSGRWNGDVELVALSTGEVLSTQHHLDAVLSVRFSPDGARFATASRDQSVRLWSSKDGSPLHTFTGHTQKVYAVAFSPDGKRLASGGTDRALRLWNLELMQAMVGQSRNDGEDVFALVFASDGKSLLAAGSSGEVRVHETSELKMLAPTPMSRIYAISLSADGGFLSSAAPAFFQRVPLGPHGALRTDDKVNGGAGVSIELEDGTQLLLCGHDAACRVEAETGALVRRYPIGEPGDNAAVSRDRRWLVVSGHRGVFKVFDLATGAELLSNHIHETAVHGVDFSPDGTLLATGSYDKTVRLWKIPEGTAVATLTGHLHGVRRVQFSPDGKTLASASWDNTVRFWDVATRTLRATGRGHEGHVFGLDWDPKGRWAVSGSWDGTLRLWDPSDGHELARMVANSEKVFAVTVDRDGEGLWYGGNDVHHLRFHPLGSPREDLDEALKRAQLQLAADGISLVPATPPARPSE